MSFFKALTTAGSLRGLGPPPSSELCKQFVHLITVVSIPLVWEPFLLAFNRTLAQEVLRAQQQQATMSASVASRNCHLGWLSFALRLW